MSNARSPREVCSTTIGISGLIVVALCFACPARFSWQVQRRTARGESTNRLFAGRWILSAAAVEAARKRTYREPGVQSFSRAAASPGSSGWAAGDQLIEGVVRGDVLAQLPEPACLRSRSSSFAARRSSWACSSGTARRAARAASSSLGSIASAAMSALRTARAGAPAPRRAAPRRASSSVLPASCRKACLESRGARRM